MKDSSLKLWYLILVFHAPDERKKGLFRTPWIFGHPCCANTNGVRKIMGLRLPTQVNNNHKTHQSVPMVVQVNYLVIRKLSKVLYVSDNSFSKELQLLSENSSQQYKMLLANSLQAALKAITAFVSGST